LIRSKAFELKAQQSNLLNQRIEKQEQSTTKAKIILVFIALFVFMFFLVGVLLYSRNLEIEKKATDIATMSWNFAQSIVETTRARSILLAIDDVTDQSKSEEMLRENQQMLQSIIDNTTAIIFIKDMNGKYLLVNKQFERLFHINNEEVKGKSEFDLFPDNAEA